MSSGAWTDYAEPGYVPNDPDGAFVYFGCKLWAAEYEGQAPGQPPTPRNNSAHDAATCPTCGGELGDRRITCMGCLSSGLDPKLTAELAADIARAAYQAEARKPKARSLAQRRYGSETKPA